MSSVESSITWTCGGSIRTALSNWRADTHTATGSPCAIAVAIRTKARCAGFAP